MNSSGDAVGPRIIPSREIRRLPPTDEGASRGAFQTKPDADSAQAKKELKRSQSIPIYSTPPVAVGFTPLCRKFVPPIPRFPLQIDARGELVGVDVMVVVVSGVVMAGGKGWPYTRLCYGRGYVTGNRFGYRYVWA